MPLDTENLIVKPTDQSGLFHLADTLEKKKYRDAELANQQTARKAASATYLNNYLDKKDYLSGTVYDPMIIKGLQGAMQQGMQLISQGADLPSITMALGPTISKLSDYSTKAKLISQQVKESAGRLKAYKGYNTDALESEATRAAFFGPDGKLKDINQVDPTTDWVGNVISNYPDRVTTAEGLNEFAKNTPMNKTLSDITTYDGNGAMTKSKAHLTGQNWLVPDVNEKGVTVGLVPKHDIATEKAAPLIHTFVDANGKETKAPVRLLDEGVFDNMMQSRPDVADYINSLVKQHINEYSDAKGEKLDIANPKAKLLARAIAYDELDRRKSSSIEHVAIDQKPSQQQLTVRMYNNPAYQQGVRAVAEARASGRTAAKGTPGSISAPETVMEIFNNNPDYINGNSVNVDGRNVIDVTGVFPKGGINTGKGDPFKYKGIYYDAEKRQLIVERDYGTPTSPDIKNKIITEGEVPKFLTEIANSNGGDVRKVRQLLKDGGYKNGRFEGIGDAPIVAQPNPISDYLKAGDKADPSSLKGVEIPAGTIDKIDTYYFKSLNNGNKWYIKLKGGKEIPFPTKEAMDEYLKNGGVSNTPSANNTPAKAQSTPTKNSSGIKWK